MQESEWRNEIQNLVSMFPDINFALICKTQAVRARGETEVCWQPVILVPHLTGEHEIPEKRELVDDNERHLQT